MKGSMKRLFVYIVGMFVLALGVSFSIRADFGVSPVSSLPYAIALCFTISVGFATVIGNLLFIILQVLISRSWNTKAISLQFIITFIFGFFMDATLWLTKWLPLVGEMWMRVLYLVLSLCIIAVGLLLYLTARLPVMPYDGLTNAVSSKFGVDFGKAKTSCDLINVFLSLTVCLLMIQAFGSIGIGTFVAAYFLGRVLGLSMRKFKERIESWLELEPIS